jgi:hypothetical protein
MINFRARHHLAPGGRYTSCRDLNACATWQAESRSSALTGDVDRRKRLWRTCASGSLHGRSNERSCKLLLSDHVLLFPGSERTDSLLLLCEKGSRAPVAEFWR